MENQANTVNTTIEPKKKLIIKKKSTPSDNTESDTKKKCSEKALAYQKEYYEKNREHYREKNREHYREKNKDREIPVKERFGVERVPKMLKKEKTENTDKVYKIPKGKTPEEYRQNKNEYNRQYYANVEKKKREELTKFIRSNVRPVINEQKKIVSQELQKEIVKASKLQRKAIKNTDKEPK
jgi:hypothetical protein